MNDESPSKESVSNPSPLKLIPEHIQVGHFDRSVQRQSPLYLERSKGDEVLQAHSPDQIAKRGEPEEKPTQTNRDDNDRADSSDGPAYDHINVQIPFKKRTGYIQKRRDFVNARKKSACRYKEAKSTSQTRLQPPDAPSRQENRLHVIGSSQKTLDDVTFATR